MPLKASDLIQAHSVEEGTFTLHLETNPPVDIVCRNITSVSEIAKVRNRAQELLNLSASGTVPPEWKPYLPIDPDTAEIVSKLTRIVVEPKFSDVEALQLCKTAGMFATFLHSQIAMRLAHVIMQGTSETLEQAKNASGASEETETSSSSAPSGGTSSPSDEKISEVNTQIDGTKTTGDTPLTSSPSV